MFEREIKFIYDFNVNQVKKLGTSFTFNSLTTVSVHPAILKYISAEIDYLIYEDRKKLVENSNFDYTGENINKYFTLINDEIRKEKRLSIEYINQLIIHATSFTVNFLAQPKWALTKLIFAKENTLTANEVRQILNYLFYYTHLRELLDKFLTKKRLVSIDKSEFENLIDKIYRQLFSDYSEKIMDSVFDAMADFFNVGGINKTKIPYQALELFLKEKELDIYLDRLNASIPEDAKQNYDIIELKKIIYSPMPVKKENYLDRIVKQEEPQIIFSEHEKKEEVKPEEKTLISDEIPSVENIIPENMIIDKIIDEESETSTNIEEKQDEITNQKNPELQLESDIQLSQNEDIIINEDHLSKLITETDEGKIELFGNEDVIISEEHVSEKMQETEEEKIELLENQDQEYFEGKEKLFENSVIGQEDYQEVNNSIPSEENEEKIVGEAEENKILHDEEIVKDLFDEPDLKTEQIIQDESVREEFIEDELSNLNSEKSEEKEENKFFVKEIEWETESGEDKPGEVIEPTLENIFDDKQKDKIDDSDVYSEELENEMLKTDERTEQNETEKTEEEISEQEMNEKEIEEPAFSPYFNDEDLLILKDETESENEGSMEEEKKTEYDEEVIEEGKVEEEKPETSPVIQDEEFDMNAVFDEKDLLIFEEEKPEVQDEIIEPKDKQVPQNEIPEEESFDESSLSFLEEKDLQDEDIKILEFQEDLNKEIKEEILQEPDETENIPQVDKSKVMEEINDEIKNLSDNSEPEFNIDVLESLEVEEHESEKPHVELSEIVEEKSLILEEKGNEVFIPEKENKPVKFDRDISYFFKGKNIDRIISNIFDDDAEDFAQTFETLSECNNIDEALAILDSLFKSNRVKHTSKEAVLITNIVNEYFNQK